MADPRNISPDKRTVRHSRLMLALSRRQSGEIVNFCPFGCEDHELDEAGYCGHLIGFYNGGRTFEPRTRIKGGRIIVDGSKRQPMKDGYKLVQITSTARVYRREKVDNLCPKPPEHMREQMETEQRERELLEFADRVRNPILDGDWKDSVYDTKPVAAAATGKTAPPG